MYVCDNCKATVDYLIGRYCKYCIDREAIRQADEA